MSVLAHGSGSDSRDGRNSRRSGDGDVGVIDTGVADSGVVDSEGAVGWTGGDAVAVDFDTVFSAAHMAAADIAVITDADQGITYVSKSFTAMTGYEPADLLGRNCRMLQGPGTDRNTTEHIRDVLASDEVFEGQILNYRKDGSAFWTALKIIPMRVGNTSEVTHYVSVQRDISNKVALLKQAQIQALHDHATGLPNRAAAEQTLTEIVRPAPDARLTIAVGLIDLDDFRLVNNTLGHAAGDTVLQQWSTRVLSRLREGDVLARMGGDEFLLILNNITRATSNHDLTHVVNRLHEAVEHPFLIDDHQVRIGMSMGVALVPEDGTDSQSILRSADEALYIAKKRRDPGAPWWETAEHARLHPLPTTSPVGDGSVADTAVDAAIDVDATSGAGRRVTSRNCRGAVRAGKVLVHFQPIVDLRSGAVTLFEALARLDLPGTGIAYPHEFLPHLTAHDLRVLFVEVLDQALTFIGGWDRDGMRPKIAVNLPPEILHDHTLPALVQKSLSDHKVEPGELELELLESHTIGLEEQRSALQGLAGLGVHLAMDDLGSGYSSLQRLSSFPFSVIKLDRGLFTHAYDRPLETLSVMATLIQMGRDLDMSVVIEGLEDESLTEAATVLGASLGQGYFFASPMPPEDCRPWFDTFRFDLHRSPMQTPLGALAYHWQFARLNSPHPLDLEKCPLTRFIHQTPSSSGGELNTGISADADAESWHARQHATQGVHPVSSRLLIRWLTQHIQASTS